MNATSRVQEDAPGHSILQHDMPDDEDQNCEDAKKKKLSHCPAAHPSCLFLGTAVLSWTIVLALDGLNIGSFDGGILG